MSSTTPAPLRAATEHGQLDPRSALDQARAMVAYVQSYNGQKFDSAFDSPDRLNLAVALDHLEETASMLLNMAGRVVPDSEGWQPIETAPKNSKARLVWCPYHGNIYAVCWSIGRWQVFGGGTLFESPTHWCELPEAPQGDRNEQR